MWRRVAVNWDLYRSFYCKYIAALIKELKTIGKYSVKFYQIRSSLFFNILCSQRFILRRKNRNIDWQLSIELLLCQQFSITSLRHLLFPQITTIRLNLSSCVKHTANVLANHSPGQENNNSCRRMNAAATAARKVLISVSVSQSIQNDSRVSFSQYSFTAAASSRHPLPRHSPPHSACAASTLLRSTDVRVSTNMSSFQDRPAFPRVFRKCNRFPCRHPTSATGSRIISYTMLNLHNTHWFCFLVPFKTFQFLLVHVLD